MSVYPIDDKFTETTRMVETNDPVNNTIVNAIFQVLINNDNFLNKMVAEIKETIIEIAENVDTIELSDSSISVSSDKFKSDILKEVLLELYTQANHDHPASKITQDASHRFVTDAEKAVYNAKASTAVATTAANGLMAASMVTKMNGIATNANNYSHPGTHPPSILASGTLTAQITASANANYSHSQIRNIRFGTSAPTSLANGEVFFVYE